MSATRRGLTLVELLASVVLLAAMAAACVPVLQRANALLGRADSGVDPVELRLAVDEQVGPVAADALDGTELIWSDAPERAPIAVSVLRGDSEATHDWVVFECDGTAIFRWATRPKVEEAVP